MTMTKEEIKLSVRQSAVLSAKLTRLVYHLMEIFERSDVHCDWLTSSCLNNISKAGHYSNIFYNYVLSERLFTDAELLEISQAALNVSLEEELSKDNLDLKDFKNLVADQTDNLVKISKIFDKQNNHYFYKAIDHYQDSSLDFDVLYRRLKGIKEAVEKEQA